jgi:hypothetical protein
MKTRKNTQHINLLLLLLCLLISSCKKFVQVDPPKSQAEVSRIFSDDQTAISAAVGLYSQMTAANPSFCNGAITIYAGLSADEIVNLNANPGYDPFKSNNLLADNTAVRQQFWSNPYKNIYQANAVLEGLDNSSTLSPNLKRQLQGEMLYIRALHYFFMVNLLGDIPLELTTDYVVNASMPRTALTVVYKQIVDDLVRAGSLLQDSYPASQNTRPNQAAVKALLAKVYLYLKDWTNAELMATAVIETGKYKLEPVNDVFLSTSKEVLFQMPKQTGNTAEGAIFIPSSSTVRPTFAITEFLLDAFEPGDGRKSAWLKSNTVAGKKYFYPYKYKARSNTTITEYYIVQRLAELYLIRAEARAEQNKLNTAIDDLDVIRQRAGLATALIKDIDPMISKDGLLELILKERQTELFTEWGNRWFDLKRTNKINGILSVRKAPSWQLTDALFPIPYTEILINSTLSQNPGYHF